MSRASAQPESNVEGSDQDKLVPSLDHGVRSIGLAEALFASFVAHTQHARLIEPVATQCSRTSIAPLDERGARKQQTLT